MGDKEMPEWDDDDDDSNLVKDLRKQLKDMKSAKDELAKELGTLRPQVRKSSLSQILSEIGVNPKIAALLPESVETDKEAVTKWLDEYGELFNVKPVEPLEGTSEGTAVAEEQTQQLAGQKTELTLTPEIQEQWTRLQNESSQGTAAPDLEKQQIAQLGRAVAASAGSFDSFVELLRNERPLPS
jgi:hypothetical protein